MKYLKIFRYSTGFAILPLFVGMTFDHLTCLEGVFHKSKLQQLLKAGVLGNEDIFSNWEDS